MANNNRSKRTASKGKKVKTKPVNDGQANITVPPPPLNMGDGAGLETTGKFIIILKDEIAHSPAAIKSTLNQLAGLREVAVSGDYVDGAVAAEDLKEQPAIVFEKLGVVVVSGDEAAQALSASVSDVDSPILAIEPEYIAYPSNLLEGATFLDYLSGYRDAVNHLYDQASGRMPASDVGIIPAAVLRDNAQFTWGLQATRVSTSSRSGQGIKVAVLDTGLDFQHPDFQGRAIVSKSFVAGVTVQDIHGHGTHCVGTACGPLRPASGVRRYGVAYGAQIFVGKVFNNVLPRPSAPTSSVIAGIEWAVTNGCRVVSLSLGSAMDMKVMQYEVPIRRALNAGTLVVAAAGNNANRPGPGFDPGRPPSNGFVEPPANADAAIAVAAIDSQLRIASFSGRSSAITGVGGIVNIAAPGVAVFSSVPVTRGRHAFFDGTSMATPHVAGIAALWAQATGEIGTALWSRLLQTAQPLSIPSVDIGAGLVQAPQ